MDASRLFHAGSRRLQDAFDSRPLADRLEQVTLRHGVQATRTARSSRLPGFFFLATADAEGRPDCSFKGGLPGFVRVTAPDELAFPDYDGNGMFKSLGNILVNPDVGLLFIDMGGKPGRLRVNGAATVARDDPLLAEFAGAQLVVRVQARRDLPELPALHPGPDGTSVYAPRPGVAPVEPAWKGFPEFRDVVPPRAKPPDREG